MPIPRRRSIPRSTSGHLALDDTSPGCHDIEGKGRGGLYFFAQAIDTLGSFTRWEELLANMLNSFHHTAVQLEGNILKYQQCREFEL